MNNLGIQTNMSPAEKLFCRECGHKKETRFINAYNEYTGKQETDLFCVNLKCEEGCGNVTNHRNWKLFGNRCKNCGYTTPDYW